MPVSNKFNKATELIRIALAVVFCAALPVTLYGADTHTAPLFATHDVIDVTIAAPITTLMDVRPDKTYLDGTFIYMQGDGTEKRLTLKLRIRGNYRRDKEHCDFAPILLNFRKSEVAGTLFAGQDKLKLVTQCKTEVSGYTKVVFREYLAYRLFRELTDISYGVRLFRIRYVDMQNSRQNTRYGFVIEDKKAVAERNALHIAKVKRLSEEDYDPASQNLVHLFEFMVGNTEYSLVNPEPGKSCCHNSDVLSATSGPPYIALPFDFDFAGLVNAPYAEPNPRYQLPSVRNRLYRAPCSNNASLPETIELFERKRASLFRVIDELAETSSTARHALRWPRNYIEEFFDIIADPDRVQKELVEKCDDSSAK